MIVAMQESATDEQIQQVVEHLVRMGFSVHRTTGERQTVLAAVGARVDFDTRNLEVLSGVEHVHRISAPYKLAGRSFRPEGTIVEFANGVQIGGDQVVVMAGPCSVESQQQLFTVAEQVAKAGARVLARRRLQAAIVAVFLSGNGRGRAEAAARGRRPFQPAGDQRGHGNLADRADAALHRHLPGGRAQHAELQSAARTGQGQEAGAAQARHRGHARRAAAFRRIHHGGRKLRRDSVRARHPHFRDLHSQHAGYFGDSDHQEAVAPADDVRSVAWHGLRDKVPPMARASLAAGADALLIEVHHDPDKALSDGAQSLFPDQFAKLMDESAHDRAGGGTQRIGVIVVIG